MIHDEFCPLSWSKTEYPLRHSCVCELISKVVERERMIRQEEKRISYMEGREQAMRSMGSNFNQHGDGENP